MVPGSSPLTRGKQAEGHASVTVRGLIPAHAGKTTPTPGSPCRRGAHPRSRGENPTQHHNVTQNMGSSPLTRGKLLALILLTERKGLIPAHAGKTFSDGTMRHVYRAHPRSRGENTAYMRDGHPELGSSPLTRGKPGPSCPRGGRSGLIPAHAGKTPCVTCP